MQYPRFKIRTLALSVGAGIAALAGQSQAQDAQGQEDPADLDRITVTGSRIKRTDVETSQPVFSLAREDIQAQGLTSVGDVIQNITANGSTLNTTFNNGGNGETRVSLRNLGSNRTLVLVNGRRWVGGTGLGGAVDLNTIPTAAVERIEVLKDGASVLYGSDAIAGVVNVILRQSFEGAEANAYVGAFDAGDGFRQSYDFTVGSRGERVSTIMGVGYVKEEPVFAGDRDVSAEPVFGTGTAFGSSTTPFGRFAFCNGSFNAGVCQRPAGVPAGQADLRPNGTFGQFTYDPGAAGSNWRNFTAADFYNFAPENYLLTPQERMSLFAKGEVELTGDVRAFATATYNNRKSDTLLASMPVVLGTGPGANPVAQTIIISPQSIYNPFGREVTRIQRRVTESGGRNFVSEVDTYAFSGGLEGSFDFAQRYFDWDAGTVYGRNTLNASTTGLFNLQSLRLALGPSYLDAAGQARCGTPAAPVADCVPLNLLGAAGSITPDMLDYISFVAHDRFGYEMQQYFANLSGELFELPGGMFSFAAGVEKRFESGYDEPDALINGGQTTGNVRTATEGRYSVSEGYLELAIPLLRDLPLAHALEFSLAARWSDYSTFGDTVNRKFGFKWRPIEDLLVRGNWAEGFRAPSVAELYTGVADTFEATGDPCSTTFGGNYANLTPEQRARCSAQGVPDGGYDQGNDQIRTSVGGNPGLGPETSVNRTLGVVWSPGFIDGFDVSLDWWSIQLSNTVTAFTAQAILDACIYEDNAQACSLYTRKPDGSIARLLSASINIGSTDVEGYDLTMNYRLRDQPWGRLSFSWDSTYMARFENNGDGDNLVGDYASRLNYWRIRSNLLARWERGDWGATWSTRFYSRQDEDCRALVANGFASLCSDPDRIVDNEDGVPQAAAQNRIGGAAFHDASIYVKTPWNARVTLGVNNIGDKHPPVAYSTFANSFDPQYDLPGRFLYLQYNQKF